VDDVGVAQRFEVYVGLEDERHGARLGHADSQLAVDGDVQRPAAVGALGFDEAGYVLAADMPLHEGHCDRILRSGTVERFAGAQGDTVRGGLDGERKGPDHVAGLVADQEEQVRLQLAQDRFYR
jgi:hypothetical protein